jgi:hypothetical protein
MNNMEAAGISAGLGALNLAKQLRRINEMTNPKKAKVSAMQNIMKAAAAKGINPKEALKTMKGKV